ncbi:LacI family DNA-binding transcriptional regulator [Allomuricauda sp. CP2A]|jgi:LacI family transcriptional regulator|uniref:LacI family DNA-binding transcriptional regulator n=1 Tax=Allomuricauda sp. CP2A TaxID=1848189 RepID=UPI0008303E81|nr:LacI family DNA-binding transcriptional regulator [Muricauda sp. CP2A]
MKRKVSLKDIAKEAGVSIATVSYVLSKQDKSGVSQQMSEKIRKIARELNYTPNLIAKSLQSGKSQTIGLIVADISNPFFAQIARIVEDEAKQNGYTVIFGSSDEKASKSKDLIKFLMNRQVDGFIITPTESSEEQIELMLRQNVPFVLIDRFFPSIDTNFVVIDNYQAAFEATKRLLVNGKTRIGMIAYATTLQHMKERVRGYKDALNEAGIEESLLFEVDFSMASDGVTSAINNMVKANPPVDAIFFSTNTLGVIGLKHITGLNLKVPDKVAVILFDQSDVFDFFYCPLTHVRQPLAELAKMAVNVLIQQISDSNRKPSKIKLGAELVIGKSCQ